jgi:hypothetical protein
MVAEATINKYATVLLTQYVTLYQEKYGKNPIDLNRYRDKWIFRNMYEDLGKDQAKKVVDYYFKTSRVGHPIKYLGNNYDRLSRILDELERDEADRILLRKETEQRVKDWEEKSGNK